MLITTGTVNEGVIRIDIKGLPEGSKITMIAKEDDGTFELGPSEEASLLAAIAEAERGEFVDAAEILQQIRRS
jgi:hypothetical protein